MRIASFKTRDSVRIFGANVDVALSGAHRDAGDGHAFDQDERIAFHDHAVGEGPAIAFVGVADDVFLVGLGVRNGLPFDAGWKSRAAAAAEAGLRHLLNDASRIRQGFRKTPVAVVGFVIVERTRIDDSAARECQASLLPQKWMFFGDSDTQFVIAAARDHRIEHRLDVAKLDRSISNAATRSRDFQHRLEPMHAARAIADDRRVELAL